MIGYQIWCDGNCLYEETGFDVEYLDELYDDAKKYCEGIIERKELMAKRWWKKVEKVAESLGFVVLGSSDNDDFDFAIDSPEGQDCNIEIHGETLNELRNNLFDWVENFDVSYETYLWLDKFGHGTNGAPYDMKDLYTDMEWFRNKGEKLWLELNTLG